MELENYLTGPVVQLPDMLAARERRGRIQAGLLAAHPETLICFTLNIAGPVKVFPLAVWAFEEGVRRIDNLCAAWGFPVCAREELREHTGLEYFLSVRASEEKVKAALVALEEEDPLGRLFDLDVLDSRGNKMSREALGGRERTCLLCGNPVFLCSRNRTHSLEAIQKRTCEILEEAHRSQRCRNLAQEGALALLREVQTTPKPGLVDMANTGAHRDMDLETFQRSALALLPFFEEFAAYGQKLSPEELLPGLRAIGIRAEGAMRFATGGVNTHKGIIFSMGILLSALGRFDGWRSVPTRESLRNLCKEIAAPLAADFGTLTGGTHGEALYLRHGVRGARGEALLGFPALFETALPALDAQLAQGAGWNEAGVAALLYIMAAVEDSNTISRSSPERAAALRKEVADTLETAEDWMAYAAALDQRLIRENISPGGSADILALAWFLKNLEFSGVLRA